MHFKMHGVALGVLCRSSTACFLGFAQHLSVDSDLRPSARGSPQDWSRYLGMESVCDLLQPASGLLAFS